MGVDFGEREAALVRRHATEGDDTDDKRKKNQYYSTYRFFLFLSINQREIYLTQAVCTKKDFQKIVFSLIFGRKFVTKHTVKVQNSKKRGLWLVYQLPPTAATRQIL